MNHFQCRFFSGFKVLSCKNVFYFMLVVYGEVVQQHSVVFQSLLLYAYCT